MNKIEVNGINYEVIRNDNDCLKKEEKDKKITEYFDDFDFIFGDYAYEKVRLKGFYKSDNKKVKDINDIKNLDEYIKNYCSFGSKVFLLKKIK